jgi:FMN phosphatase YigB (HAD superfamily)
MTKPRVIKLILCDLGNVLIRFDHRIAVERLLAFTKKSFDEVYRYIFDSPSTKVFEEGRISPRGFFRLCETELRLKDLCFKNFVPIWNEIFFDNAPLSEVLESLKNRYRLHLISNVNELHYDYIARVYPERLRLFDEVYLSCRIGARKPDHEIFRRAVEERGFQFHEAFYVDDREDLIDAARRLGISGVVFKGVDDLKEELSGLGMLS